MAPSLIRSSRRITGRSARRWSPTVTRTRASAWSRAYAISAWRARQAWTPGSPSRPDAVGPPPVGHDLAGGAQPRVMRQVFPLDALEFRIVVVRRILRPAQQHQLKRFEFHTSLWQGMGYRY